MAKTHRTIQQWNQWLGHFPGTSVLEAEEKFLSHLLAQYYGKQALLIGTPAQAVLLKSSSMATQVLLSPIAKQCKTGLAVIESGLRELPILSGSADLVILPHILELVDNPRQLLAEACRIVKPEGHLIICGFNPYSLWGFKKLFAQRKNMPWAGNFIKTSSVKKWLSFADFELLKQSSLLFRPHLASENAYQKLGFLEWIGRHCFFPFGSIYVLLAQAKVIPLTPIKLRWKQQLSDVRLPIIGVPKPSIRNRS